MIRVGDKKIQFGRFENGPKNSLTDVKGIRVGHNTLVEGSGKLVPGNGPVRTGVTMILPSEDIWKQKFHAGSFIMNGNGEACGLMWLQESGVLETPIALTNTLSVGAVQSSLVNWMAEKYPELGVDDDTITPLVFECDDSVLNDIRGQHIQQEHVFKAIETATDQAVIEGAVGAGTGMIAYELKGGIGSSSRKVSIGDQTYSVGVLLNSNHGKRHTLSLLGNNIGPKINLPTPGKYKDGSVVVIVATDAPLDSRQLNRLAKRTFLGISRTGGISYHSSGDVVLAFSTANKVPHKPVSPVVESKFISDFHIDDLFEAASDACEEAMIKVLLAAKTTIGRDDYKAFALSDADLHSI